MIFFVVCQSVASLIADPGVMSLIPAQSHTFTKIDNEIFCMVIRLFLLIKEGLLSVTSESMCTKYWLTGNVRMRALKAMAELGICKTFSYLLLYVPKFHELACL